MADIIAALVQISSAPLMKPKDTGTNYLLIQFFSVLSFINYADLKL
jgi:hypothetical protein